MQLRCTNVCSCSRADSGAIINARMLANCPECGEAMSLCRPARNHVSLRWIGLLVGIAVAMGCVVLAARWFVRQPDSGLEHRRKIASSEPTPGPPVPTPSVAAPANHPSDRYASVDALALSVSPSSQHSIKSLAQALCTGLNDDESKARSIFRWLTAYVAYDFEAFDHQQPGELDPEAVIRKGKAVCGGIAKTFDGLAHAAGLETVSISGRARNSNNALVSHAWNAVKIYNKWRLIDATFGIGYAQDANGFHARFDGYFFFPPPEELIYSHFPWQPEWQLLERPLTLDQFSSLPPRESRLFKYRIRLPDTLRDPFDVREKAELTFTAPEDITFLAALSKQGQQLANNLCLIQRQGPVVKLDAYLPEIGEYEFILYVNDAGHPGQFASVHQQTIRNSAPCPAGACFPTILSTFWDYHGKLETPTEGVLHSGSNLFRLHLDGANAVYVSQGTSADLQNESGIWQGKVMLVPGEANVVAHFGNDPHAWILLKYQVVQ